jgi:hypothetical protein
MVPRQGDILLRGCHDRGFQLLDAISHEPIAGVMAFDDAIDVALSMSTGAVWQQYADENGRPTGPLVQLLCRASDPVRQSGV